MQTPTLNAWETPPIKTLSASLCFAHPWLPDQGDTTYCNPIIHADYSDPDVVRIGADFYLTASSFNCTPGLPVLHSPDLVNWTIIGHALKNLPHAHYAAVQPGCGVWAPAFRFHAGKFWIFYPTPDEGIFMVSAGHPAGPWSEPHCVQAGKGLIDPCPLWDDDGQAYLAHAYAGSRAGIKHMLRVRPMALDGSKLLGEGRIVFHQPEKHPIIEGPKFLKKDGWYYLSAPAGGVETGWQVILRSKNIYGPYEDKIVLAQGATDVNGPHQGALVDTPGGDWWFVHFQDAGVYGRIVHLQPVTWQDGWPVIGRAGEPVRHHAKPVLLPRQAPCAPATSDAFAGPALGLQWQWPANHRADWFSLTARPGWLRLYPQPARPKLVDQPNVLLQKFPALTFTAETLVEASLLQPGEEAGLVVMGQSHAALAVRHMGAVNVLVFRTDDQETCLGETPARAFRLRVEIHRGGICEFSYALADEFVTVPQTVQATKGKWVGAKLGLYSLKPAVNESSGSADFHYFRFA